MYKHLLVPADGSVTAERGLSEAIALAADQHARLTIVHVIDDFPLNLEMASVVDYDDIIKSMRQYGQQVLDRASAAAAAAGVQAQPVLRQVSKQRVADVILDEAAAQGCDLVVMGTHGRRGFNRFALGSDAELVVRRAAIPVLLVRQEDAGT